MGSHVHDWLLQGQVSAPPVYIHSCYPVCLVLVLLSSGRCIRNLPCSGPWDRIGPSSQLCSSTCIRNIPTHVSSFKIPPWSCWTGLEPRHVRQGNCPQAASLLFFRLCTTGACCMQAKVSHSGHETCHDAILLPLFSVRHRECCMQAREGLSACDWKGL